MEIEIKKDLPGMNEVKNVSQTGTTIPHDKNEGSDSDDKFTIRKIKKEYEMIAGIKTPSGKTRSITHEVASFLTRDALQIFAESLGSKNCEMTIKKDDKIKTEEPTHYPGSQRDESLIIPVPQTSELDTSSLNGKWIYFALEKTYYTQFSWAFHNNFNPMIETSIVKSVSNMSLSEKNKLICHSSWGWRSSKRS